MEPRRWHQPFYPVYYISSVSYISVDDAVNLVKKQGVGCNMAKIDLKDAYRVINVRPEDWHYLGSTWTNDEGEKEYYIDFVLPFGLKTSAKIFTMFADELQFCMKTNSVTNVTIHPSRSASQICKLCVNVNPKKTHKLESLATLLIA